VKLEHYEVIEPLRFTGMRWTPYGAIRHPIVGPVDLYWVKSSRPPSQDQGVSSFWYENGAVPNDEGSWGIKLDRSHDPQAQLVSAFANFERNHRAGKLGLAPPAHRMCYVCFEYGGPDPETIKIEHHWGFTVSMCDRASRGLNPIEVDRIKNTDWSGCQNDKGQLGDRLGSSFTPGKRHIGDVNGSGNCGVWKGNVVCLDWGPHVLCHE
jgi:hypothetical protein